jgi:TetR/AcrR family transcriptional regulator, lmrAB and yxaGH operons repressor
LYYHFPQGKDEIALEAIKWMKERVQTQIQAVFTDIDDPIIAIQSYIRYLASKIFTENEYGFSISLLALENSFSDNTLRVACIETYQLWQDEFENKLLHGGFCFDEAQEISGIILFSIEGAVTLSLVKNSDKPLKILIERIPVLVKAKK